MDHALEPWRAMSTRLIMRLTMLRRRPGRIARAPYIDAVISLAEERCKIKNNGIAQLAAKTQWASHIEIDDTRVPSLNPV